MEVGQVKGKREISIIWWFRGGRRVLLVKASGCVVFVSMVGMDEELVRASHSKARVKR